MNKFFSVLCVLALMLTNFTFAQYGGGGSSSSQRSGGSSSALVRDNCPSGDTSGSFFDGSCGDEDVMDDDNMDDDDMMEDEDILEEIMDNNDEDMDDDMMDDDMEEGTSLFDLLRNRGSSTSNPINGNSSDSADGSNGFVLPGVLAATGADPRVQ